MGDPVHIARAKIARAVRSGDEDAEQAARIELTEAHLARLVDTVLARPHKPRLEAIDAVCARLRAGIVA
jgi:hypothetical protein